MGLPDRRGINGRRRPVSYSHLSDPANPTKCPPPTHPPQSKSSQAHFCNKKTLSVHLHTQIYHQHHNTNWIPTFHTRYYPPLNNQPPKTNTTITNHPTICQTP